jgi:NAD(P)-dependent dehydrogenase (short-subunit alcohol dehydrogenase family)
MTTNSETNNTPNSQTTRHQKSAGISRRQMMAVGGAGLAGLAAVATGNHADANTQQPIASAQSSANPNGKFANKIVLITGATSGIGEATARAFAKEGATVHFCGRREALGAKVAQEINAMGGRASYQKADVRNEQDVKSLIDTCVQKYGRIDIAFNNAGIESPPKTIEEMTLDDWNNVMATNLTGVFLSMKYELPVMKREGGGIIINTASVGGHNGFSSIGPYGASKAGVMSLARGGAMEYTDKNIRINSLSPGAVDTPMFRRAIGSWGLSVEDAVKEYPIKRVVTPEEIARAVMWLASDDATCIVGMDLDATGGYMTK